MNPRPDNQRRAGGALRAGDGQLGCPKPSRKEDGAGAPGRVQTELQEAQKSGQRELDGIKRHRERIEELERDKEALLDYYEGLAPGALDSLTPEERHRFYTLVRLQVRIHPGPGVEIS